MNQRRRGHAALRAGRCSLPNHAYLLTTVCANRIRRFDDFDDACRVARVLSDAALWRDAQLLSWVLMPDHWHGLVVLGECSTLPELMHGAKGRSSRAISGTGRLWSPGYFDRALRSDEDFRVAARYVVANPLRAGLVERLGDYPFWGCRWGEGALWLD
jgi:REP element-mobilizing transposase RayT